jgi:hypothetical protein
MNKKQAFAYFDLVQKNPVWSWSAISDDLRPASYFNNNLKLDARLVGITLWEDQMNFSAERTWKYSNFNKNTELWQHLPGNADRIEHIQYCLDFCSSIFRAIIVIPVKDGIFNATREIKDVEPFDAAWFKILEFNSNTGEFTAESILE